MNFYPQALCHGLPVNNGDVNTPNNDELIDMAQQWAMGCKDVTVEYDALLTPFIDGIIGSKTNMHYPIKPLSLKRESIFPTTAQESSQTIKDLWSDLDKEITKLNNLNLERNAHNETLFFLLKKYTSQIALNKNHSHLSLFELIKLRAAIANALNQVPNYGQSNCPLIMFCADLSGIQDFLYNIAKSKAAKSLKGRSFYLQLLINTVVEKIITKANVQNIKLSWGQVVYASGGKLFMLLPNTEDMKNVLTEVEKEYLEHLFEHHRNELYVCMERIEWGYDNNMQLWVEGICDHEKQHIGDLWKNLIDKTAKKKQQKFKNQLVEQFNDFFKPITEGGDANDSSAYKVCAVTGEKIDETDENQINLNYDFEEKESIWVTPLVLQQTELGKKLKFARYYSYDNEDKPYTDDNTIGLGICHYLQQSIFISNNTSIRAINDTNFLVNATLNSNAAVGFLFYGGNKQPQIEDRNARGNKYWREKTREKTYEELAGFEESDDKGKGFKRLGVLRMDVDGLGGMFAGYGENSTKISMKDAPSCNNLVAYATLSAQLDLFFSGYLNTLRNQASYNDWINILYSGGDDLFIVGRWDLCIEFAELIRNEFRSFLGNSNELSISGGLALVGAKFPISKAADLADDAEKAAKKFNNKQKNAFCFLNETVSWEDEFEFVKQMAYTIQKWLTSPNSGVSKQLVYKIYQFRKLKQDGKLDWRWLSAYYFARSKKKNATSEEIFEQLKRLFFCGTIVLKNKTFKFEVDRAIDLLALACRWAELLQRNEKLLTTK